MLDRAKFSAAPPVVCPDCYWKAAYLEALVTTQALRAELEVLQGHHRRLRLAALKRSRPVAPEERFEPRERAAVALAPGSDGAREVAEHYARRVDR